MDVTPSVALKSSHLRRWAGSPAAAGERTLLMLAALAGLYLFWGAWHDIYAESAAGGSIRFEWQALVVVHTCYVLFAAYLAVRRRWALAALTLGATLWSVAWQHGIGLPGWQESSSMGLPSLAGFAALATILVVRALRGPHAPAR